MQKIWSSLRKVSSKPSTSFQVLSDVHLEVGRQYNDFNIPVSAPYLVLAGDIGRLSDDTSYLAFLSKQAARFTKVFLVLGNHEFYGTSYSAGLDRAKKLQEEPDLKDKLLLLHQTRFDIPDSKVTVLGCSLWSHIPDQSADMVRMKVNDFRQIKDWTVDAHNAAHEADLAWLSSEIMSIQKHNKSLQSDQRRSILVATHYAPTVAGVVEPRHERSPINCAFSTELLTAKTYWKDVSVWAFGHTHFSTEFRRCGIRLISNQRGYAIPGMDMQQAKMIGGGCNQFDEAMVVRVS